MSDARASLLAWLERRGGTIDDYPFPSRIDPTCHMSTRQYARLVDEWVTTIGLRREEYGTHSLRRTKASIIYKATGYLRAVQILLGHTKIENTVRYLGVDIEDALALSEGTEIWRRWRSLIRPEGSPSAAIETTARRVPAPRAAAARLLPALISGSPAGAGLDPPNGMAGRSLWRFPRRRGDTLPDCYPGRLRRLQRSGLVGECLAAKPVGRRLRPTVPGRVGSPGLQGHGPASASYGIHSILIAGCGFDPLS